MGAAAATSWADETPTVMPSSITVVTDGNFFETCISPPFMLGAVTTRKPCNHVRPEEPHGRPGPGMSVPFVDDDTNLSPEDPLCHGVCCRLGRVEILPA